MVGGFYIIFLLVTIPYCSSVPGPHPSPLDEININIVLEEGNNGHRSYKPAQQLQQYPTPTDVSSDYIDTGNNKGYGYSSVKNRYKFFGKYNRFGAKYKGYGYGKNGYGRHGGHGRDGAKVCKHHDYKNWFELISPCFKQFVGKGSPNGQVCRKNKIKGNILLAIQKAVKKLELSIANDKKLIRQSELMWKAVQQQPFREWCPGNFQEMIRYLKVVLTIAPQYLPNAPNFYGVPISTVLLCYLRTQEGRRFFASPPINAAMMDIVNRYAKFLESKESLYVINSGTFGWKSPCALKDLNYMQDYVYNKADQYWGYKSYNDFFTRRLRKGVRPIYQEDNNKVINAFGDTGFVNVEMDIKNTTKLWIKNEDYSLFQMFDNNPALSDKFIGGTAMQVFFSASKYHHYYAPVSGKVIYAVNKHGIIYAIDEVNVLKDREKLTTLEGWVEHGQNGLVGTVHYLAHVASRAIVVIENDLLGPVALFFIGMTEISSCLIEPEIKKGFEEGNPVYVKKGEHLGNFQYGGSTGLILLTKKVVQMKKEPFWNMTLLTDNLLMGQPILIL